MPNTTPFTRRVLSSAVLLGTLSLLNGCLDHDSTSTPAQNPSTTPAPVAPPTTTAKAFNFSAKVTHDEAAGSTYTISQPSTTLAITGTVDNDGRIDATIPAGTDLAQPLQVSVSLSVDTFKYLSENVKTLETIASHQKASRLAKTSLQYKAGENTSANVPEITLRSTAEFALADTDLNGLLSDQEIQQKYSDSVQNDYDAEVEDLMIAAEAARKNPSKLYYKTTYEMMGKFRADKSAKNAFFATNSDIIQTARQSLFNKASTPNEEVSDFLRLDSTGWPLIDQTLAYSEQPWSCVDDIRRVSIKSYGTRLWNTNDQVTTRSTHSELGNFIQTANSSSVCNKSSWRLPTVTELSALFSGTEIKFPNTFPTLDISTQYWATNENSEQVLVNFSSGAAVTTQPIETDSARVMLHSFEPYDVWFNIDPVDTPVDLTELRNTYSQSPSEWPAPTVDEGIEWQELGLRPAVPFPADNPYSEEKVALGKELFFDTSLSKDDTISCASCHDPAKGWADGIRTAVGIDGQKGPRNTPTIINTAYYDTLFLDGRVGSLEEQSLHPISNPIEMGLPHDELLLKLDQKTEYAALFNAAFGNETITLDRIAKAIATFERTIISTESAFDQFLKGDSNALTDQQLHGLHLFRTKARCMNCHSGPMMTNNKFENIGLTYYGRSLEDRGRYNVTYKAEDMGRFRVPMLRDIKTTDPTTHLGLFQLAMIFPSSDRVFGLLAMYNNGMTRNRSGNFPQYATKYDPNFPTVSPLIERLAMTPAELKALNAFMSAISADVRTDSASPEEMGIVPVSN
ncbi:cytochrome c peroxidase [Photobacterium kasasachensis]|uniref:cytochrome c peroxidase n=1 Tax=Photobacterium kasasachensis TaxID=2910240 RepID=UPI003D09F045